MSSTPRPRTYTWDDKQTQVLDHKGLARMNLRTQDLVTQIKGGTQLLPWVGMMQKPVRMWRTWTALGPCLEKATQEEERVLVLSKKAMDSEGHKRRTNISITWSMPTTRTYPTREGVIKSINKVWFLARLTSVHTMRRAMNNQRPRWLRRINTKDSAKKKRSDTQDLPAGQEHKKIFS